MDAEGFEKEQRKGLPIDSVYFLMYPKWRTEARSNRWIYGCRWARHVPLVLVQPELPSGAPWSCEPEPRIANSAILSIQEANPSGRASFSDGLLQASQIAGYMRHRRHCRPLLWFYNPSLAFAYALLPAVLRIFHATENYFDFGIDDCDFLDLNKAAAAISDKVICCSSGVLEGLRAVTGRPDLEMIPNGCDYKFYAEPGPPNGAWINHLRPLLDAGRPIAVFAGGINLRMDFPLMNRLAKSLDDVHFAYAGPVDHDYLTPEDRASWAVLLHRPNVSYFGEIDPGDLPQLYRLADRGFIPYRHLPFIVKDGFPLKALEMAAAGLPVVASLMEPLLAVPEAVQVVSDGDAFLGGLRQISRRTRSPEAAARADAVCRRYDYDRMFERVLGLVREVGEGAPARPASLVPIYDILGFERALPEPEVVPPAPPPLSLRKLVLFYWRAAPPPGLSLGQRLLWHIPPEIGARVPGFVKGAIKRIIIPPPRGLSWQRRILWRIPPFASALLPTPLKSAIRRSLRL